MQKFIQISKNGLETNFWAALNSSAYLNLKVGTGYKGVKVVVHSDMYQKHNNAFPVDNVLEECRDESSPKIGKNYNQKLTS